MQISISNAIESLSRGGGRIIQFGLQLWLDFIKSDVIGSELITNGNFATDTDWYLGTGWNYGDNEVVRENATSNSEISQDISVESGSTYSISYTREYISGGGQTNLFSAFTTQGNNEALGNYTSQVQESVVITDQFTPTYSGNLTIRLFGIGSFIGSISNISVKEVTQFVMDKSPNTNNAKLFTGKALSFDGGNDQIDLGSQSFAGSDITVAVWSNAANLTGTKSILGYSKMYLRITNDNIIWYSDVNANTSTTFVDAATESPQRLVLTQSGTEVKLYVDGTLFDTRTLAVIRTDALNSFIGAYFYDMPSRYEGVLSDVQIYNKTWDSDDVAFDYNNPNLLAIDNPDTDLVVTDLKGYWALSEGDGLVAYDSGSTLEEDVVQNGDFSELGSDVVQNGDFSELGSEQVTNGDFATNDDWIFGNYWNYEEGFAFINEEQVGTSILRQSNVIPVNTRVKVSFNVTDYVSGNLTVKFAPNLYPISITENKTYTIYTNGSNSINGDLQLISDDFIGSVSNISVKQVDPNDDWILGAGWSYGDDKAVATSTGGILSQNISFVSGKTYKIVYDIILNSGQLFVRTNIDNINFITLSGQYVDYFVPTSTANTLKFDGKDAFPFDGSITNISVKEVDPNDDWTLGTGWSYGDDKAVSDGTSSSLVQTLEDGDFVGRTYQISLFVSNYTSGYLTTSVGGYDYSTIIRSNGTHTLTVKVNNPLANDRIYLSSSSFNGSVTNVSLTEITQSAHGSNTTTSGDLIGATYVDKQPTIPQLGMMDWAKGSNLITYSEDLTATGWSNQSTGTGITPVVTNNFALSPIGVMNASRVILDIGSGTTSSDISQLLNLCTIESGKTYATSMYVKSNTSTDYTFTVSGVSGSANAFTATQVWQRISVLSSYSSTSGNTKIRLRGSESTAQYADILVYAPQVELDNVGNYILTDGAEAIDVTTIQNPTNKGYDILGNPLRLREGAFNLDGTGYAEVADSDSLDITTAITLEAWVFINDENGKGIISKWKGVGKPYMMYKGTDFFRLYIDQTALTSSTTPLNEWVYCVATYDGTTMKAYVNADANTVTTKANSAPINTNTDKVEIGRYLGQDSKIYSERIDDTRIYNRALTQEEITYNYNIGLEARNLYDPYVLRMAEEGFTLDTNSCVKAAINALK